jgi:hypothetical protein
MNLAEEALELGEQRVTPRQVWRGDAVPWTEWVREVFSSGSSLSLIHRVHPWSCCSAEEAPVGAASAGLCT